MPLHLIKLSVGSDSVADLQAWVAHKVKGKKKREYIHVTRMFPKRAEEIVGKGSIFWVIKGEVACRQRVIDLRAFTDKDGISRCRIVADPKLQLVRPRPWRAFQGWRYLEDKDAPPDLSRTAPGTAAMPEPLRRELRELGLL